jgi:hypothetical protein
VAKAATADVPRWEEIGELPSMAESTEDLLQQDWTRQCYQAAISWIATSEERDWIVVHGTVLSEKDGKRINHAWCERGEIVVDLTFPVGARIVERERYYQTVKPEVNKKYSFNDALILAVKTGHPGPWGKSEQRHQ